MRSAYPELDRMGLHGKARERRRHQIHRDIQTARGLNSRGTPRVVKKWPELKALSSDDKRRWHNRACYRRRADKNMAMGLCALGQPRKDNPLSPRELAWRKMRASMDIARPEIASFGERHEPEAREAA